jgi:hypothetical protein
MTIREISAKEYGQYLQQGSPFFLSAEFNELNKYKADRVLYLVLEDTKPRFVICFGLKENRLLCPYSAPFGMLSPLRKGTSLESFDQAVKAIDAYAQAHMLPYARMILPPVFYDENNINMLIGALSSNGYLIKHIDINYQFHLLQIDMDTYMDMIHRNARKNLNISLRAGLRMECCIREEEKREAYEIIRQNREYKGYPLRMTFEQVSDTIKLVEHNFFIVRKEQTPIASAIVFHVKPEIAQVIYWGDAPGYSQDKPINFLSYHLIQFYKQGGFQYLDIGPSTEHGIPNFGLCDFKQSIGCDISNKFTFEKFY